MLAGATKYKFRAKCYQEVKPFGELFHGTNTFVLGGSGQLPPILLVKRKMTQFQNSWFSFKIF